MARRPGSAGRGTGRRAGRPALLALALAALIAPAAAQEPPPPASLPASLIADRVGIDTSGRLVAEGGVEVWQGSVRLTAQRIVYDQTAGTLEVTGPMVLSDGPDRVVLADGAQLSDDLRAGLLTSARVVLNQQVQLAAARLERRDGRITQADAVIASSCAICAARPTPLWEIRAARVTHDQETRRLTFEGAQFRALGVPLAAIPHLSLPDGTVDRAAGALTPEFGFSSELGLQFALPVFIPLGDDRDLTLTPMVSTGGMVGLAGRWRQVWASGALQFEAQVNRDGIRPGAWRGFAHLRGQQALGAGFVLSADGLIASDRPYLTTYRLVSEDRIRRHVTVARLRRDEAIRARLQGFESLRAADDNTRLPAQVAQFDWDRRLGLLGGDGALALRLLALRRPSRIDGPDGRDVARLALSGRWQRQAVLPGGVLATLGMQGRLDHARVGDDSAFPAPLTRTAAEAMLDLRWPLARVDAGGGQQLLEPVVQLIGARRQGATPPNEDHRMPALDAGNLFAPVRHTGLDAADDGSRINAGLRWMRHAPSGWSFEALAGRIWRREALAGFAPDHRQPLGAIRSDTLLAGRLAGPGGAAVNLRVLLDGASRISRSETGLSLVAPDGTSVAARHLFMPAEPAENRPAALNALSVDLARGFGPGWQATLGWDFDVTTSQFDRLRSSVTFRNECVGVDVFLSRRFVTSTNLTGSTLVGLRVQLLGLTGGGAGPVGRSCRA